MGGGSTERGLEFVGSWEQNNKVGEITVVRATEVGTEWAVGKFISSWCLAR